MAAAAASDGGDGGGHETKYKVIHVCDVTLNIGRMVEIQGWASRVRAQGGIMFVSLRDGTLDTNVNKRRVTAPPAGFNMSKVATTVQCFFPKVLATRVEAKRLLREARIMVRGVVKAADRHLDGVEIAVESFCQLSASDKDLEARFNKDSNTEILGKERALVLRTDRCMLTIKSVSIVVDGMRAWFKKVKSVELFPPQISKMEVEGGATLMRCNYFGEDAYLTQSQQLFLEISLPAHGDCHCIQDSFRAEKSRTRRHQSEFLHCEGEAVLGSFEQLLAYLQEFVMFVATYFCEDKHGRAIMATLNPRFCMPTLPFRRMSYKQCIAFLNEHKILCVVEEDHEEEEKKDDSVSQPDSAGGGGGGGGDRKERAYVVGDDIPQSAEMKILELIEKEEGKAVPVMMTGFAAKNKAFYTRLCADDPMYTESVDVCLPTVGEVIGAGMRKNVYEELKSACVASGFSLDTYREYLDVRKYGAASTGGFGAGVLRFVMWLLALDRIHDAALFPRTCTTFASHHL